MVNTNTIRYKLDAAANVTISLYNANGELVKVLADQKKAAGVYTLKWQAQNVASGNYFIQLSKNGALKQTLSIVKQ